MPPFPPPFLLVIEPSLTMRKVIEVILRRNAHTPSLPGPASWATFADPVSALRALRTGQLPVPHIGLICRDLPYLDGYEVIQHMRQRGYATVFVVLFSSDEDGPLERIKARLAGAQITLTKPFTVRQLLQTLASALR